MTFISLLYLLHKRSYVLRAYIYVHGHTGDENVTRTRAYLHTFIPYGDRSGSVTRIAMGSLLTSRMQLARTTSVLYRESYIS